MKILCLTCERVVGCYVPRHGDGSAVRTRRHFDPNTRQRCEDRRVYDTADTVDDTL